jgi:hypothetical protein
VRAETMMATDAVRRVTKVEQSLEQGMQSAGSSGGNGSSPSSDTFTATVGASVIVRSMGVTATVIKIMSDGTVCFLGQPVHPVRTGHFVRTFRHAAIWPICLIGILAVCVSVATLYHHDFCAAAIRMKNH